MLKPVAKKEKMMWQFGEKRPFLILFMALGCVVILGLALPIVGAGEGSVVRAVARALWSLVPGAVWLAATAVSLIWLLVMTRLWQR